MTARAPLFLSAVLLLAIPAAAQGDAEAAAKAKELFQTAQKLYKSKKYADAIAKFEEAYTARPHPVVFFNIGKCWEQLNEPAKAMRSFKDYLRAMPDAADKASVVESIVLMEKKLREKGLQQVVVVTVPEGARVEIDGKDIGIAPASTEVVVGPHRAAAKLPGLPTMEQPFRVEAGKSVDLTLTLRASDTPTAELKQPENPVNLTPTPSGGVPTVADSFPPPKKKGRVFTWVAAGVAGAGLAAGIGLGVASSANSGKQAPDRATADQWLASAKNLALGANISYGVAAAAATKAVVLFFLE